MDPAALMPLILPAVVGTLADDTQRSAIEKQIADYLTARGIGALALGNLDGILTDRLLAPEQIAHFLMSVLTGELGIDIPGYPYPFTR